MSRPPLREDALIRWLVKQAAPRAEVPVGVGDDAAVVRWRSNRALVLTTDLLVEGVHFRRKDLSPALIGRKALAVGLSDVAAMGALPSCAVVAAGMPRHTAAAEARALLGGVQRLARQFGCSLVGGDSVRASRWTVCVTVVGWAPAHQLVRRSGACVGDQVVVTGPLGYAYATGHHARFTPRVREAAWLVRHLRPTAMMDLSDGLATDLPRLASASGVGARIHSSRVPLAPGNRSAREAMVRGEDFELLLTVPPRRLARAPRGAVRLFAIGEIVPRRRGLALVDAQGRSHPWPKARFAHFA